MKKSLLLLVLLVVLAVLVPYYGVAQKPVLAYMPGVGASNMAYAAETYNPTWLNQPIRFSLDNNDPNDLGLYPSSVYFTDNTFSMANVNRTPISNLSTYNAAVVLGSPDSDPNTLEKGNFFLAFQAGFAPSIGIYSTTPWVDANTGQPGTGMITNAQNKDQIVEAGFSKHFFGSNVSVSVALKYMYFQQPNGSWNGSSTDNAGAVAMDLSTSYIERDDDDGDFTVYRARISNLGPFGKLSTLNYSSGDFGDPTSSFRYLPTYVGMGIIKRYTFKSGDQFGFMLDGGKELFPSVPDPNDPVAIKNYKAIGPFLSPFESNEKFGGSVGAQYIMGVASNKNFSLAATYTDGSYFEATTIVLGSALGKNHIFLGYQIPMTGSPIGSSRQIFLGLTTTGFL